MNVHSTTQVPKMIKLDKRDEILRAARELIAEHGFHGAPMALIADRAGVGAGTIYRYFENKDVLIGQLHQNLEERLYPHILTGYAADQTIRARFLHLGTALLHYFIANPLDYRFLQQFYNSPYGVDHRRDKILGVKDGNDVFCVLFAEGVTQQVLKDLPMVILFGLYFGPLLAVARDHILGFIQLDEDLITRTVAACWEGIQK